MPKIFFNSSMPRAGSTLLQNILAQNPDIYATPTSGVLELLYAARANYTESLEFKAQDADVVKKGFINFCKEGIHGYFDAIVDVPYVIDKSRGWGMSYEFLNEILGYKPKIICMVRDLRQIISSMEKKHRADPLQHQQIVDHAQMSGTSTFKRANIWLNSQPVGLALERILEIFTKKIHKEFCFIRYEDLTKYPQKQLDRIYEYLELPSYEHNFDVVEQVTKEDDTVYGTFGDHSIRKKVEILPKDYIEVLGRETCNYVKNFGEFYFKNFNYS